MAGYSLDLRERVVKAVKEEKQSTKEVAERFRISRWTVNRYLKRYEEGQLAATKHPGQAKRLDGEQIEFLRKQSIRYKDWTLEEHAEAFTKGTGIVLKKSSVANYFKLLGITSKKDILPSRT